ncbi:TPA: L-threonine 3-dehydrogenase [Candidatus Bipolaricaulota bacterium]|nr:L-threonine 3-dehydrogenase [Candidatus Bipolaricaulota bacterium]
MKAVVKAKPEPGAELKDVDVPTPGPGEVLIRVAATSICGTDLHIYEWNDWAKSRIRIPQIMGHELAGYVEELGPEVRSLSPGDYVSAETHIYCGRCFLCHIGKAHICRNLAILGVDRDGAFAEYIVVPERVIWKNDPALPPAVASIQEPFGNAVHAVKRAGVAGKRVLIFGDGTIGLMSCAVAKALGADAVWLVGLVDRRLELARALGADRTINAGREDPVGLVRRWTGGLGAEAVLEMAGAEAAFRQALEAVQPGGRLIAFGLPPGEVPLDVPKLVFKEVEIIGVVGREIFSTWEEAARLLARIDLSPVVTHELPLAEFRRGFEVLFRREAIKVILCPGG